MLKNHLIKLFALTFTVLPCQGTPSIYYNADFDAREDAIDIHDSVKGPGTDEGTIREILTDRTCAQRQDIMKAFQDIYNYDIKKRLGEDTSGSYEQLLKDSFICGDQIYVEHLWRALHNEYEHNNKLQADKSVIEILVIYSESAERRQALLDGYQKTYNVALIDDIKNRYGDDQNFLKSLIAVATQRVRQPRELINEDAAQQAGVQLNNESAMWNESRDHLDTVLLETSLEQLTAVFNAFHKVNGNEMEVAVKKKMKGNVQNLYQDMITFVKWYANAHREYYAIILKEAVEGPGTHISALTRTILYHSESDLKEIEDTFRIFNVRELRSKIAHDTSGEFEALLVAYLPRTPAEEEEKKKKRAELRAKQKERKKIRGNAAIPMDALDVSLRTGVPLRQVLASQGMMNSQGMAIPVNQAKFTIVNQGAPPQRRLSLFGYCL